ncbi:MAG TPA: hypothetical protein VIV06_12180 [Candidatus Limnocylindrales bacterium]
MTPRRGRRLALATIAAAAALAVSMGVWPVAGPGPGAVRPAVVLAASPTPTPAGGDTRSPGEGPGLVGAPILAIGGVLLVGVLAAAGTLVYVRVTEDQRDGHGGGIGR